MEQASEARPSIINVTEAELRPIPPERRHGHPRWEVWLDGERLGIIQEQHLGGARLPFYEAIETHPRTGKPISLEMHTDRQNRVDVLVRFAARPEEFHQHWT